MRTLVDNCVRVVLLGILGTLVGSLGTCGNFLSLRPRRELRPMPYQVPMIPGGTSLRMAMVHDILHERYLVHGEAWQRERVRAAEELLRGYPSDSRATPPTAVLDAMDDLAVALIHLHEEARAAEVMRSKLAVLPEPAAEGKTAPATGVDAEQAYVAMLTRPPLGGMAHERYTAEANLGTALIHAAFGPVMAGDADAQGQLREGLEHIERATALNPGAHFGRERWQALAVRHLLLALQTPELLTQCTVTGDTMEVERARTPMRYRRVYSLPDEGTLSAAERWKVRQRIAQPQLDGDWAAEMGVDTESLTFDEPTLAIIGMWTMGGGPNAHFALALGRLMEDVGQREIAWEGCERAVELAGDQGAGFSGEPAVAARLVAYCREREGAIAAEESADPAEWERTMRSRHRAELAWGEAFQRRYQTYEANEIAAGRGVNGAVEDAGFLRSQPAIASAPGLADEAVVTHLQPRDVADFVPSWLLGVAVCLWADEFDHRRRRGALHARR